VAKDLGVAVPPLPRFRCQISPLVVLHAHCTSVIKQYNLVWVTEYPSKTGFKILGLPQINLWGVKVSLKFRDFPTFRPFLHKGARYHQSINGLSN